MIEEITMRMGLDATPVGVALRGVKKTISGWSEEVRGSLKHAFESFAAPLTGAGILMTLERTAEKVKRIRSESEAVGVSTGFLQDIENVAQTAGVAGDAVQGMINKFVKGLPAGSDVEQEFYKMADKLSGIEDPAERARVAVEAFGKSGVEMVKVIGHGSAAVKQLGSEFAKFSDQDIAAYEEATKNIEQAHNRITIGVGKLVGAFTMFFRVIGSASQTGSVDKALDQLVDSDLAEEKTRKKAAAMAAQARAVKDGQDALHRYNEHLDDLKVKTGTAAEKLEVLNKRFGEASAAIGDTTSETEYYAALEKVADLEAEINKTAEEANRKTEEADRKAAEAKDKELKKLEHEQELRHGINQAKAESVDQANSLNEARGDRSKFSLAEMANSSADRWTTPEMREQMFKARQVQQAESRARWLAGHGFEKESQELFDKADKVRSGITALNDHDRQPFKSLEKSSAKAAEHLAELLRKSQAEGLNIVPQNGA